MYAEGLLRGRGVASSWQRPWLLNKRWDLTYISLSALLVPTPFLLFRLLTYLGLPDGASAATATVGLSATAVVDIVVALIVGGPHMTSTYTLTFMNRNFTRRYPLYVALAFALPVMVTVLGIVNLRLLLTVFMMWASIHVLHQIAYLADCYRTKGTDYHSLFSRAIDYGVIFTSLYPMAMVKLVQNRFVISNTLITIPLVVGQDWAIYAANALFFTFVALWFGKTYLEYQQRRANLPKTLLMAITVSISYVVPLANNLDVAFQGMNVWHSFQYLGLTWYLNKLRQERGQITNPLVDKVSGAGHGPLFYLLNVAMTMGAGAMVVVLYAVFGMPFTQGYYIVILSCLLIHYYFDHFMFTRVEELAGSP